jgi:hypothetical protein
MAHASGRNLMGFLDAFKAILPFRAGLSRAKARSLTHCEDFA